MSVRPVSYNMISNRGVQRFGFVAQEIQDVLPQLVEESKNGMLGVSYTDFVAPLLSIIQLQQKNILQSRKIIEEHTTAIKELHQRLCSLEQFTCNFDTVNRTYTF
jgi:hypothetical protein